MSWGIGVRNMGWSSSGMCTVFCRPQGMRHSLRVLSGSVSVIRTCASVKHWLKPCSFIIVFSFFFGHRCLVCHDIFLHLLNGIMPWNNGIFGLLFHKATQFTAMIYSTVRSLSFGLPQRVKGAEYLQIWVLLLYKIYLLWLCLISLPFARI